jgi:hypothetical protein
VNVEGWTLLGSMLGVFPVVTWTRPVLNEEERPIGWEARVEARTRAGEIVGAAEAECIRSERSWTSRDDYALRSMAQTRAVSKALRLPLGFVMQLAGFDPTPAEEMPVLESRTPSAGGNTVGAAASVPAEPFIEMSPPSLPPVEGAPPAVPPKPTKKQKDALNALVGQLRQLDRDPTAWIYETYGREQVPGEDGLLHWSDVRETLTRAEASSLFEQLSGFLDKLQAASSSYDFEGRAAEVQRARDERVA